MINIVCVKWGPAFDVEYVNKLHAACLRHSSQPFRFICFTDDPKGVASEVECREIPFKQLTGWWNKMYLFCPSADLHGRVMYFDLDTVIIDNIDELLSFSGNFAILGDLYGRKRDPRCTRYGSGVMSWVAENQHHVWHAFASDILGNMRTGGGDQNYLMRVVPVVEVTFWQDFLQKNKVCSYKADVRDEQPKGVIPLGVSVVCFHGKPRPHEERNLPWMLAHWKE